MAKLLVDLQRKRSELLQKLSELEDFRPGSISPLTRRCGTPGCRCCRPGDPGHGPNLRLTYKLHGKTYSESFAGQAEIRSTRRQIAEFRKFQQLMRDFVEVNATICRVRSSRASSSRPISSGRTSASR
jgi:hypothetical protein